MTEPDGRDRAGASWSELEVAGLDGVADAELEALLAELSTRVAVPVRRATITVDPPAATVPGRREVDADLLLARLETAGAPDRPLVGVTAADLALPIFTFVFGRARLAGRAALVSTHRLRPEFYGFEPRPELVVRRAVAEILHELGHVAGLEHCSEPGCLMRFAASIEAADLRGDRFCDACLARLPEALHPSPPRLGAES